MSVEQAMADYAVLLTHLRTEHNATSAPVIAFGGSYGGMLAAWLRIKFPAIIQVAVYQPDTSILSLCCFTSCPAAACRLTQPATSLLGLGAPT